MFLFLFKKDSFKITCTLYSIALVSLQDLLHFYVSAPVHKIPSLLKFLFNRAISSQTFLLLIHRNILHLYFSLTFLCSFFLWNITFSISLRPIRSMYTSHQDLTSRIAAFLLKEHIRHRRARKIPSFVFLMMSVLIPFKIYTTCPAILENHSLSSEQPYLLPDF